MMDIRPATVSDLPHIAQLWRALVRDGAERFGSPYPTLDDEEHDNFVRIVFRQMNDNPNFIAWVAVDEVPIGFLGGEVLERAIGKPHVFASPHWLYVHPGYRGQGVARGLITTGTTWLRERRISHVEITSLAGDEQWTQRGFQPYLQKVVLGIDAIDAIGAGKITAPTLATEAPAPKVVKRKRGRKPKAVNGVDVHPES